MSRQLMCFLCQLPFMGNRKVGREVGEDFVVVASPSVKSDFSEVEAVRLRWFLGALIPMAVEGWQMDGTDQHGEPVRGASSFVAGRRAPVGYVGV